MSKMNRNTPHDFEPDSNQDKSRFESRIREAREEKGLSQEALAREAKVSRETIRNIERGVTIPNVILAISLGAILGWAVTELFKPKKGENEDGGNN